MAWRQRRPRLDLLVNAGPEGQVGVSTAHIRKRRRMESSGLSASAVGPKALEAARSVIHVVDLTLTAPVGDTARMGTGMGLPPLRHGAPARRPLGRGSPPDLSSIAARCAAETAFHDDVYAQSSWSAVKSRLETARKILQWWKLPVLPLTVEVVHAMGAGLKAGRYRSAAQILSAVAVHAERRGTPPDASVRRALSDAARSCSRGLGPPHRVQGLPIHVLARLPQDDVPVHPEGPRAPVRAMLAGSWWLTREIELSNARAAMVVFRQETSLTAEWNLPASETDPLALGATRLHGCCCHLHSWKSACPAHVLWRQRAALRTWYPERHSLGGVPHLDLPLFPTAEGRPCTKKGVTATIEELAHRLGFPRRSPEGLVLWTGHSLRVAGAQSLAAAGLDLWAVQLMGRWGSSTVLQYIRETPLKTSAHWASQRSDTGPREELRRHELTNLHSQWKDFKERILGELRRVRDSLQQFEAPNAGGGIADKLDVLWLNVESGVAHVQVEVLQPGPPAVIRARCSWTFSEGLSVKRLRACPVSHRSLCERCFPVLRGQRKARLVDRTELAVRE